MKALTTFPRGQMTLQKIFSSEKITYMSQAFCNFLFLTYLGIRGIYTKKKEKELCFFVFVPHFKPSSSMYKSIILSTEMRSDITKIMFLYFMKE